MDMASRQARLRTLQESDDKREHENRTEPRHAKRVTQRLCYRKADEESNDGQSHGTGNTSSMYGGTVLDEIVSVYQLAQLIALEDLLLQ